MRWDNILVLLIIALMIFALRELVVSISLHGPSLQDLYERTFKPEMRPILKLELLLLGIAVLVAVRRRFRRDGD